MKTFTGIRIPDHFMIFVLEHGVLFFYVMLVIGLALNLMNAIILAGRERFESMRSALLLLRTAAVFTYPALLWGLPFALFYLIGPKQNEHILFLLILSFPTLNLSGAFYAVPLVLELRKKQNIGLPAAIFYLISSFIIGLDIVSAFLIRRKLKEFQLPDSHAGSSPAG